MAATVDPPSSRPLDPGGLAARVAPFTGALLLAFALLNLNHDGESPSRVLIAAGVAAVLVLAIGAAPWRSLPGWTQTVPPLAFFLLVAVLVDADGGSRSSFAPLALLPVLWLALYGTRGQLLAGILGAFAVFLVPMVWLGAPKYPPSGWLAPTMWMVNAAVVGTVVHELVREVRSRAIQVENLASADELTSLPSRTAWDERLPQELHRAHREKWQVSVAMFVVDGLDDVRAEQGNDVADELLRQTAFSWSLELRGTDVLARYADDAFVAAFPGCSLGPAAELAESLKSLARGLTVSGGVACWDGVEEPSVVVARASAAAAEAGQVGGNAIVQAVTT